MRANKWKRPPGPNARYAFVLPPGSGLRGPVVPRPRVPVRRPARTGALAYRADRVLTTHVAPPELLWMIGDLAERYTIVKSHIIARALVAGLEPYRRGQARQPAPCRPARQQTMKVAVPKAVAKRVADVAAQCRASQSVVVAGAVEAGIDEVAKQLRQERKPRSEAWRSRVWNR